MLAGAIVSEVTATMMLKAATQHALLYAVVVSGYVLAFGFLALALRRGLALGVAYGVWGALGVAGTAVLSSLLYHEAFTVLTGIGIALIIGGVLVVEVGSQQAERDEAAVR